MELTLANVISSLLVLAFNSLITDIECFFSDFHFFLQFLSKFFSTKWNTLWVKMQISNTWGALHKHGVSITEDEKGMQIADLNLIANRLGVVGWMDDSGNKGSVGEEYLLQMFDEEEPSLEEIKETFGVFDVNKDGFIDARELQIVLSNLGLKEGSCLEECKRMIQCCDGNGDGLIDFHDFLKFMEKCLC